MSLKMMFLYTLLFNILIFLWYGVKLEQNQVNVVAPHLSKIITDKVPIILVEEVDQNSLVIREAVLK